MTDKKTLGQSVLFTHTILIGFTLFIIFVVVVTFSNLRSDYQEFAADNEMRQVCLLVKNAVEGAYIESDYASPTNTTHGYLFVDLPDKLLGTGYRTGFTGDSVYVETYGPSFNVTCKVGLNITYAGSSNGGLTSVVFTRSPERVEIKNA